MTQDRAWGFEQFMGWTPEQWRAARLWGDRHGIESAGELRVEQCQMFKKNITINSEDASRWYNLKITWINAHGGVDHPSLSWEMLGMDP